MGEETIMVRPRRGIRQWFDDVLRAMQRPGDNWQWRLGNALLQSEERFEERLGTLQVLTVPPDRAAPASIGHTVDHARNIGALSDEEILTWRDCLRVRSRFLDGSEEPPVAAWELLGATERLNCLTENLDTRLVEIRTTIYTGDPQHSLPARLRAAYYGAAGAAPSVEGMDAMIHLLENEGWLRITHDD